MKTLRDEELVRLVKDEDSAEAFEELLKRYRKIIYSIAGKIFYSENIQHATKYEAILEGESALGLAITKYDKAKGDFKSYVTKCIQGEIINYINKNKSLIKSLLKQRKLQKVKSAIKATIDKENPVIDIKKIKAYLMRKYPDESAYWDDFLEDYIIDIATDSDDISLDSKMENGKNLHEIVKGKDDPGRQVLMKEAISKISAILSNSWTKIAKKESKGGNKRGFEILYRYYVKGESSDRIIQWLNNSGVKGYELFRQAKSREFNKLCQKYKAIFRNMVLELNRIFEYIFIKDDSEEFCKELKELLQTLANTGILVEAENV